MHSPTRVLGLQHGRLIARQHNPVLVHGVGQSFHHDVDCGRLWGQSLDQGLRLLPDQVLPRGSELALVDVQEWDHQRVQGSVLDHLCDRDCVCDQRRGQMREHAHVEGREEEVLRITPRVQMHLG